MTSNSSRLLGEAATGRENALDAIRLIAALAVLVSHAWPITGGPGTPEPLQALTGHTLGTLAVMVFFGLSGFLITLSYIRTPSLGRFSRRRARRILPGLLVCLLLSVLVLGPLMTTLPLGVYLTDPDTWRFLLVNGSLLGFRADLPGVFAGNPFPAAAGSIWTLSHEIACYAGIAVLGASGVLARRSVATAALSLALVAALLLPGSGLAVPGRVALFSEMAVPFAVGALFCLWRDRILLAPIGVLGLAVAAFVSAGSALYDAVLPVALVYGTLTLGFGPWASRFGHWIRHDYSYGVYIYAFPVQGLVVASAGPMGPWMNIALALPPTLVLAALSWHCVEKPMMTRKPFRAPIAMSDERAIRSD